MSPCTAGRSEPQMPSEAGQDMIVRACSSHSAPNTRLVAAPPVPEVPVPVAGPAPGEEGGVSVAEPSDPPQAEEPRTTAPSPSIEARALRRETGDCGMTWLRAGRNRGIATFAARS